MEQALLSAYYEYKGWNDQGVPTVETLNRLGLDYVAEDLVARGMLTDDDGAPGQGAPDEKKVQVG
jgi:hypothetical protein